MVTFPPGNWLTVAEVMGMLCVSRRRVQVLAKRGTLKSVLWLGQYLIDKASAEAFKAGPRKAGRPPGKTKPEPGAAPRRQRKKGGPKA